MVDLVQAQYDYTMEVITHGTYYFDVVFRLVAAMLLVVWQVGLSISSELHPMEPSKKQRKLREVLLKNLNFGCLMFVVLVQLIGFDPTKLYLYSFMSTESELNIRTVGVSILWLGVAGSVWTRYVRGTTWAPASWHLADVQDHKLITTGPYAVVRHPFYLSMWLIALGFQLAVFSGFVVVALFMIVDMLRQAKREEKELEEAYKDEYRAYKTRTRFFLPLPTRKASY